MVRFAELVEEGWSVVTIVFLPYDGEHSVVTRELVEHLVHDHSIVPRVPGDGGHLIDQVEWLRELPDELLVPCGVRVTVIL
jgi:hypothetical protein